MRTQFDQHLEDLQAETVDILRDTATLTQSAVDALLKGDAALAKELIEGDDEFDRRTLEVEDRVFATIATQAPVAADLRLLQTLAFTSLHTERMADLAANIAKTALRTTSKKGKVRIPDSLQELIKEQARLVGKVLVATIEAFQTQELADALRLPELDAPVDALYERFFKELSKIADEDEMKQASRMVMSAHYLERISDHAVDIGERLVYLITGERNAYDEIELSDAGEQDDNIQESD